MYKPIKKLGQNFLISPQVVDSFVSLIPLDCDNKNVLIEIGPGLGVLTVAVEKYLFDTDYEFYAVEIDDRFVQKLNTLFSTNVHVHIEHADILEWLPEFNLKEAGKTNFVVFGSLPYYITSPILHSVLYMSRLPDACVFLIQKEVAHKVSALSPNASYLSVLLGTFYEVTLEKEVSKKLFNPSPKVDGGIIKLVKRDKLSVDPKDMEAYVSFLHKGFTFPRKMLNKVFDLSRLTQLGINPQKRPQELSIADWVTLFNHLRNIA